MKRCSKKYINPSSPGFTLIELMTAVAIVGILAAMSIPNYLAYRQKAEFAALQHTLQFLMDAQDIYFVENNTFYPANGRINIKPGQTRSMPELNYTLGPNHKYQFIIRGHNRTDDRGRQINSYWIEVRSNYDFDGNGRKDRVLYTTMLLDGELISQREFRQYR